MKRTEKNYGVELFRLFAMFLIVVHHYSVHGKFEYTSVTPNSVLIDMISIGGKIGVNCFILITGYYSSKSSFSFRKVFKLVGQVEFYSVLMSIVCLLSGAQEFSKNFLLKTLFPFFFGGGYWFICIYLLLYFCIPFIENAIENVSNKQLGGLIVLFLALWSVFPYTTKAIINFNNYGYSNIGWFVIMYLIGAYMRKFSPAVLRKKSFVYLLLTGCSVIFAGLSLYSYIFKYSDETIIRSFINNISEKSMNGIFPILISVSLFVIFQNMEIKPNKVLLCASSATFGVYLLHDNAFFSEYMFETVFKNKEFSDSPYQALHVILCTLVIFAVGIAVDTLRKNLLEKKFMNCRVVKNLSDMADNFFMNKSVGRKDG